MFGGVGKLAKKAVTLSALTIVTQLGTAVQAIDVSTSKSTYFRISLTYGECQKVSYIYLFFFQA